MTNGTIPPARPASAIGKRAHRRLSTRRRPTLEALEGRTLLTTAPYPMGFLSGPAAGQPLDIAKSYLAANGSDYGVSPADVSSMVVTDQYQDNVGAFTTHIYLRQSYDGLQVFDANLSVNITPAGEIINIAGGFVPGLAATSASAPPAPGLTASQAILDAAHALGLTPTGALAVTNVKAQLDQATVIAAPGVSLDPVPAHLQFLKGPDNSASLAWNVIIRTPDGDHWYDASVDAFSGQLLKAADWVDHYTEQYNVLPLPTRSPDDGPRVNVQDPADPVASPYGWLTTLAQPGPQYTTTQGNNTVAYEDTAAADKPGHMADGGANHNFDFPLDLTKDPASYQDAAITDLFYWTNLVHDLHYHYGFDEAAGNFQVNNYGNGGLGGDPLNAEAQDGSGLDNANMATPPDGQSPRMQMYLFDITNPKRDGDLDPEIIAHEFGHGVSNRLTGGPSNASALDATQSGGMGEGWSDFWATSFTQHATDNKNTPRPTGTYVLGQPVSGGGVRRYPYSYDMTVDPLTIAYYNQDPTQEVHNTGEIWATILWDMNWLLIDKHGYNPDLTSGYQGAGTAGNILALQLVMDGLKLQPVNPSFIDARNAILSADLALTGGENQAAIWTAFARRGLGLSAQDTGANATTVSPAFDMPVFTTVKAIAPANAAEHVPLTDVTVATIDDPTNPLPPASYVTKIDWGDGTTSFGTVVANGTGKFLVKGTKTYDQGGAYTIRVTVSKVGSITISSTAQINVKDSPMYSTGTSFTLKEGDTYQGLVATFTDTDIMPRDVSEYTASIDWGDGSKSIGTIVALPGGSFEVDASHAFGAGDFDVKVSIKNGGGTTTVADTTVSVSDLPITANAVAVTGVEGTLLTVAVATFVDDDPRSLPGSYYSAVIDWGDGSTSPGTITGVGGGIFQVLGSHLFKGGKATITVTISDSDVTTVTVQSPSDIAAAPVQGFIRKINVVEGVPFQGVIAEFASENKFAQAADFGADIDWGDNTQSSGRVVPQGFGEFVIVGTHTFSAGTFYPTIKFVQIASDATTSVQSTANVTASPINATASPLTLSEGAAFHGVLASFKTVKPNAQPGDYKATINWGDNSPQEVGTITANKNGGFDVTSAHSYKLQGRYGYAVLIETTNKSASAVAGSVANVVEAPLSRGPIPVVRVTERTATGPVVAGRFTYGNPFAGVGRFVAAISWGDGTTTSGIVQADSAAGSFKVLGNHAYATPGTYGLKVTVQTTSGQSLVTQGTAIVSNLIAPLRGALESASDTGVVGDWVTSNNQPVFTGSALANTAVTLYAVPAGQTNRIALGQVVTNATGAWRIQSAPLGDGAYAIYAQATGTTGQANSALTPISAPGTSGPLVIATTGPSVSSLTLDPRTDTLRISLQGNVGALDWNSILNPANYQLSLPTARRSRLFSPAAVSLDPSSGSTVLVKFNAGRMRGNYIVTLSSAGITDLAGNSLSEKYFLNFPGTSQAPGDPFVAQISTDGRTASAPSPFVPADQLRGAAAFERFLNGARRFPRALRVRRFRR